MKYVACLSRLGSQAIKGPVTGKKLVISRTGDWIDEEDAEEIVKMEIEIYCLRLQRNIKIKPFFYANPTVDAFNRLRR